MTRIGTGRLLVTTFVLLLAAGCGGGGGDGREGAKDTTTTTVEVSTTTSPPTKAAPTTTATAAVTTAKPTTPTTTAPAELSPTQFIVAKPGCKNEIDYVRVGADRKVVQSKAIVKAAGNSQLIAYAERNDKLLFGAFNCDTNARTLSEIALTDTRAAPRLIASDLDVYDADYDIKSNAVLALAGPGGTEPDSTVVSIDTAGTRTVRWRRPAAWKNAANPLAAINPGRLRALTGGEMMIGGDGGGKFIVARVSEDGYTSSGVTGDGKLGTFDISILQGAIALSIDRAPDLYVCAFGPVYGAGQSTPTPITSVSACASNPLPRGITSLPAELAWAFSGQDGHNLLLVIRDQPMLLDVESLDLKGGSAPPKIYGSAMTDVPYGPYTVAVYVIEKDLSKALPSVTV